MSEDRRKKKKREESFFLKMLQDTLEHSLRAVIKEAFKTIDDELKRNGGTLSK